MLLALKVAIVRVVIVMSSWRERMGLWISNGRSFEVALSTLLFFGMRSPWCGWSEEFGMGEDGVRRSQS
jgi:hypothetical protein